MQKGEKKMLSATRKYGNFRILVGLLLCVLFSQALFAQIPASDDAYTASSSSGSNFGTQPSLNVIGPGVNSYIRFDLTALPANLTSANVSKATLRLNINGVTTGGTFDVYLVTKPWTEGALTYRNAPTLGAKVASAVMIAVSKRNFIDVDVTSAVQAWLTSPNPAPNYGIALVASSGSSTSVSFDTKENTSTSHDPELNVATISGGAQGPQGPSGPAGPTGAAGPAGSIGPQGLPGSAGPQGLTGATGPIGPQGSAGPVGPPGATGPAGQQGPAGANGPAGPEGPQGLMGFAGTQGPQGPPGPAGSSLASFDSLAGLPCTRNSQAGMITITYSATGDAALNCALGGTGQTLASISTRASTVPGQIGLVVNTTAPVPQDLNVVLTSAGQVLTSVPPSVVIPAGSSSADFALQIIGTTGGTVTITASAGTSTVLLSIQLPPLVGALDSDGDGIPDVSDACPFTPSFFYNSGSYCPASIYQINSDPFLQGAVVFTNVTVTNVSGTLVTISILPTDSAYDPSKIGVISASFTMDAGPLTPPALGSTVTVPGSITKVLDSTPAVFAPATFIVTACCTVLN
jgi:hypothetical protein